MGDFLEALLAVVMVVFILGTAFAWCFVWPVIGMLWTFGWLS